MCELPSQFFWWLVRLLTGIDFRQLFQELDEDLLASPLYDRSYGVDD